MKKNKRTLHCFSCGTKVVDGGELHIGGHPFQGWFHLQEHGGSTRLEELQKKKEWDFCSIKCLERFSVINKMNQFIKKLS